MINFKEYMFRRRTKFIQTFWGGILGKTNILVVEIKLANVVRKKQQLLGIFINKTVTSICVVYIQLSGCTEKLLADYICRGAEKKLFRSRKIVPLMVNAYIGLCCYQSASRDRPKRVVLHARWLDIDVNGTRIINDCCACY